jgi:hypothetical protein
MHICVPKSEQFDCSAVVLFFNLNVGGENRNRGSGRQRASLIPLLELYPEQGHCSCF